MYIGNAPYTTLGRRKIIMPTKRNVEYWYNKAEETRVIAQTMKNETNRQIMLSIAADFERLAHSALDQEQETVNLGRRSELVDILMNK